MNKLLKRSIIMLILTFVFVLIHHNMSYGVNSIRQCTVHTNCIIISAKTRGAYTASNRKYKI